MATRRCMSMETSDGKPCENEVDVGVGFLLARATCASRRPAVMLSSRPRLRRQTPRSRTSWLSRAAGRIGW